MRRRERVVVAIGLLIAAGLWVQPLRRTALTVFRFPLVVVERAFSLLAWFPQLPTLVHEHASLRSDLAAAQLELVRLRETVRHLTSAQRLSRTIGSSGSTGPQVGAIVSIIGRTLIPTVHTVILDHGAKHGVVPDSVLMDARGIVGRVLEVYPTTALGMLVTDPNSRIAVMVERSRESALFVGTGEGLCRLLYLDLDADVVVEDRIVTAGLGGPFPKGVLVGTVTKVIRDERQTSTAVWVRPAVRVNQLEEVVCLPPAS